MRVKNTVVFVVLLSMLLLVGWSSLASAHDGDQENGKALFGEYCAVCHGYDGQGRIGAVLTDSFASIDPAAFVRSTVSNGVADMMPAFAEAKGGPLDEEELDDIGAYILSWQERVEPAPTPTPIPVTPIPKVVGVTGDPTSGVQVFARECQVCHGEQGRGGIGASLSGPISAAQPAAFLRQIVNDGVGGSPMPAFRGVLSEDEVENVIAFVLSWDHSPAPRAERESDEQSDFIWIVSLIFLVGSLVVIGTLVVRFSQRKVIDDR